LNRAPQGSSPNISAFHPVGGVALQAAYQPLSTALPISMRVDLPPNNNEELGSYDGGFWGISVTAGRIHKPSFYVMVPKGYESVYTVSLRSIKGKSFVNATAVAQSENTTLYPAQSGPSQHYATELTPLESAPDVLNALFVNMNSKENVLSDNPFSFNLVSSFGETYKNRENGMRKDVAKL